MDALVRLGDHGAHAEQRRCPWPPSRATSRSRTPCRPARPAGRPPRVASARRRRSSSAAWTRVEQVDRVAALDAGSSWLRSRMLRERAADHHLVVAAPRAVGVEVLALDAVLGEVVPAGLSALIDPAGLMWSVVTESPSLASTRAPTDVGDRLGRRGACRRSTAACARTSSRRPTRRCRRWASAATASARRRRTRRRSARCTCRRRWTRDDVRDLAASVGQMSRR